MAMAMAQHGMAYSALAEGIDMRVILIGQTMMGCAAVGHSGTDLIPSTVANSVAQLLAYE